MNDETALVEIESIKQLKARYCRYLDNNDWDRWRDLFTDDFLGDTTQLVKGG
jgi:3-phenylpropionate/cinnamic acid dioxygenase small subunit